MRKKTELSSDGCDSGSKSGVAWLRQRGKCAAYFSPNHFENKYPSRKTTF
jgi:hypothetical protein